MSGMSRGTESAADRELTTRLAERGLSGSSAKYERWRHAGLLPRHERHGAGRDRGSVSLLAPSTVEIAAVLARHTGQGRSLRGAVVTWFLESGRPVMPGTTPVPEPPEHAVPDALVWAVHRDPGYRLRRKARAAVTDEQVDEFFEDARKRVRYPSDAPGSMDPGTVREAILRGEDIPEDAFRSDMKSVHAVRLLAALGLGAEEIGAELFADTITASGMMPGLSGGRLRAVTEDTFACDSCMEQIAQLSRFDEAEALERAGIEQLRRAREIWAGLAGCGAHLMMHALLMPDTPGDRTLRAKIDELAAGPLLMAMARQWTAPSPGPGALTLASCLQPYYETLHQILMDVFAEGPPLMHLDGSGEHDPGAFMDAWLEAIPDIGEEPE